ncbi:MAG: hypothetical protein AAB300_00280, partial [Nitrospirota bacterium]
MEKGMMSFWRVFFLLIAFALFGPAPIASARIIDDFTVAQPLLSATSSSPASGTTTGAGTAIIGGTRRVNVTSVGSSPVTVETNMGANLVYSELGDDGLATLTYSGTGGGGLGGLDLTDAGASNGILMRMVKTDADSFIANITITSGGATATFDTGALTDIANISSNIGFPFSRFIITGVGFSFANVDSIVVRLDVGVGSPVDDHEIDFIGSAFIPPLTVTESFTPSTIGINGTSTLTILVGNPTDNPTATAVAFTNIYPANVVNAAIPNATTTCTSGTITGGIAGESTVGLTGGSIPAGMTCTVTVVVTSGVVGVHQDFIPIGDVTSANVPPNTVAATATLTVTATPPTVTKSFSPTTIAVNATSTMTITINNPSGNPAATGVSFTDTYPFGLVNAAVPNATSTCTGGAVIGGTLTATANAGSASLTGGSLPAGASSCVITITVTSGTADMYINEIPGGVSTFNIGTSTPPTPPTLTVTPTPPTVTKSFSPTTIAVNA